MPLKAEYRKRGAIVAWGNSAKPCSVCGKRSPDHVREVAKLRNGKIVGPCCAFDPHPLDTGKPLTQDEALASHLGIDVGDLEHLSALVGPELKSQMLTYRGLMEQRDAYMKALERIALAEVRADRRHKGMVDMAEVEALRRIARTALQLQTVKRESTRVTELCQNWTTALARKREVMDAGYHGVITTNADGHVQIIIDGGKKGLPLDRIPPRKG